MTREAQFPGFPQLNYVQVQTNRTVHGVPCANLATAANQCATARPTKAFRIDTTGDGVWAAGYTRTSPNIKTLRIAWYYRGSGPTTPDPFTTLSLALVIRDNAGHSVGPSDNRIPPTFQGGLIVAILSATGSVLGGAGWIDLDAVALDLTGPDWSFEFTVGHGTLGDRAYVERIECWEVPRSTVDSDDAAGALLAPFGPGNPILAGDVASFGWERLEATLQAAAAVPMQYLSLSWPLDTGADIPHRGTNSFAALTNFREAAGVPVPFRVRVRPKYFKAPPGSADGEAARFRVLFLVGGGGTGAVRLITGATASPYDITGLTTSGSDWAWSDWLSCELPSDGTDQLATLTFEGLCDGGTLYLAGIVVEERAP